MSNKWTKEEVQMMFNYRNGIEEGEVTNDADMYKLIHQRMYNEGNHPEFPIRTLRAMTDRYREEGASMIDYEFILQEDLEWY